MSSSSSSSSSTLLESTSSTSNSSSGSSRSTSSKSSSMSSSSVSSSSYSSSSISSSSVSSLSSSTSSLSSTSSVKYEKDISEFKKVSYILNGDLSYDISISGIHNSIDISIFTFSKKFDFVDIEVFYREEKGDDWLTDMYIESSTASFINGNKLFRMAASSSGVKNIIRWDYKKNKFNIGSSFQIKIVILPSIKTFNHYGYYTIEENIYSNFFNEIKNIIPYKVLGLNNYGNYMCSASGRFLIVDKNKNIILEYNAIGDAVCARQISNDHYFILDESGNRIIEISDVGDLIYQLQSSVLFNAPKNFIYDELINNVLVSGGNKHTIYEISWNDNDKGSVIWQHGTGVNGSSIVELSYPTGVAYDTDRQIVYVADSGNKRIKKIDRRLSSEVITVIDSFNKDGVDVEFNTILNLHINQDQIIVVEKEHERELFNSDIREHPSLARALKYNRDGLSFKNHLDEYGNLLFPPLLGT